MWGGEHDETTMAVHNDPSRKTPRHHPTFLFKERFERGGLGVVLSDTADRQADERSDDQAG